MLLSKALSVSLRGVYRFSSTYGLKVSLFARQGPGKEHGVGKCSQNTEESIRNRNQGCESALGVEVRSDVLSTDTIWTEHDGADNPVPHARLWVYGNPEGQERVAGVLETFGVQARVVGC